MPVLVFGLEAVVIGHPAQQVLDSADAGVGYRSTVRIADNDLLVLAADPPLRPRLAAFLEYRMRSSFFSSNSLMNQPQSRLP